MRVAEHDGGAVRGSGRAGARAGRRPARRRGPSRCARRPPPPPARAGSARRSSGSSTLPCTARTGGPSASSSARTPAASTSPPCRTRSAARSRSTHASGSRRPPRGRWVSEMMARRTRARRSAPAAPGARRARLGPARDDGALGGARAAHLAPQDRKGGPCATVGADEPGVPALAALPARDAVPVVDVDARVAGADLGAVHEVEDVAQRAGRPRGAVGVGEAAAVGPEPDDAARLRGPDLPPDELREAQRPAPSGPHVVVAVLVVVQPPQPRGAAAQAAAEARPSTGPGPAGRARRRRGRGTWRTPT